MKMIYILPLLCLTACGFQTPEQKYYAVKVAAKEVALEVETKVDTCLTKAIDDPCRDMLPVANKASKALKSNVAELDKIFVTHDSQFYNLGLSVTENAINDLKVILGGL